MDDEIISNVSRRKFLKTGTCGLMSIGPLVNTIAQLKLVQSAAASTVDNAIVGTDYKALVCLFLSGGCDTNNLLVPIGNNPQRAAYETDRSVIQITEAQINAANTGLNTPSVGDQQYGLHQRLPKLANLYNRGQAAFLTNVGTLAEPTDRDTIGDAILPRQLFSHSDQVTQWMSSISDRDFTSGWGGRVADLINDAANPNSSLSMQITAAGNNQFMVAPGGATPQYTVTTTGAISLNSFGTNYSSAYEDDGVTYRNNSTGQRLKAMEQIMAYSHAHILEDGYNTLVKRARESESRVSEALNIANGLSYTDPDTSTNTELSFQAIFDSHGAGNTGLGQELLSIVNIIAGREAVGNTRQIFFVDLGGFDNHAALLNSQAPILEEMDNAIAAFQESLELLSLADSCFNTDQVTLFQASDFNRTWTPNSDNPSDAGTDHGWGGHTFIVGGAVNGGQLYGRGFPALAVGGENDVPSGSRGRWIPTTSVDEYSSVLAHWFGIDYGSSEMETIFPNLSRFIPSNITTPPTELAFMA